MKVVTNLPLIERNRKISRYLIIASMIILGIGMYVNFTAPEILWLPFVALLLGFLLSQIGMYYLTRWGRNPRPDEVLTKELKGLDDKYTLYHYKTNVNHLLIGPAGIWALVPFQQRGTILYDSNRNRWTQQRANVFLRFFGAEGLGRPEMEVRDNLKDTEAMVAQLGPAVPLPPPQVAMVFIHPEVQLQAQNSPVPAMKADKLKDFIRKRAKESPAPMDGINILEKALPQPDKEKPA